MSMRSFLTVWFVLLTAGLSAQVNLLPSIGLDTGEAGRPAAKTKGWYGPFDMAFYSDECPPGLPYSKSVCLDFTGKPQKGGTWCVATNNVRIEQGKSYRLSVWLKTEGKQQGYGSTCGFYYLDGDGKAISGSDYQFDKQMRALYVHKGPLEWQRYTMELRPAATTKDRYKASEIPPNTAMFSLRIGAYNYPKRLWFTQPILEELRIGDTTPKAGDAKVFFAGDAATADDFVTVICPPDKMKSARGMAEFSVSVEEDFLVVKGFSRQPEDMTTALMTGRNNPGIWGEDYFDIAFDPSGTRSGKWFQFAINPCNSVNALWRRNSYAYEFQSRTERRADGWGFELRVPMKRVEQLCNESGLLVRATDWDFNIARHWKQGGDFKFIGWCYSERSFHSTANMGHLMFKPLGDALDAQYSDGAKVVADLNNSYESLLGRKSEMPQVEHKRVVVNNAIADYRRDADYVTRNKTIGIADFAILHRRSIAALAALNEELLFLNRASFGIPEEWKKYGFVPWQVPLLTLPNADMLPINDKPKNLFAFEAPLRSHGSIELAFFPDRELTNMRWSVSFLKSEDGDVIPASNVTVRALVKYPNYGGRLNGWLLVSRPDIDLRDMKMDDLLNDTLYASVRPFAAQFLYVKVKSGAKPGTYKGKLTVSSDGAPTAELALECKVLPFGLEEPNKKYGFFYLNVLDRDKKIKNAPYAGGCTPDSMERELQMLYADGCRIITLYCYATGPLNPVYAREVMTIARKVGFEEIIILGAEHLFTSCYRNDPAKRKERLDDLKAHLIEVKRIADELGFRKMYVYSVDEALSPDQLERLSLFSDAVHEVGLETACALIFEQARKAAENRTDLVMMSWRTLSGEESKSDFNKAVLEGRPFNHRHAYYYPILGNTPFLDRLVFGWYLYKSNYEGCFPWSWYEFQKDRKPSLSTIRYVVQTADGGIVPSLRYEAAIEGIQDMRFIRTIEARCKNATPVLDELKGRFPLNNSDGKLDAMKPQDFVDMREAMIKAIIAEQK